MWKPNYPLSAILILLYQALGLFFFAALIAYLPKQHEFTIGVANHIPILGYSILVVNIGAVVGAIIADNYIGRFRTAFWSIQISILGVLSLSFAAERALPLWLAYVGFYLGLVIVCAAAGAFIVTVPTLVADQLSNRSRESTDSVFDYHFIIGNVMLLVATSLCPLLLNNVKCLGNCHCTPLFYGLLLVVAIVAQILIVVFWSKFNRVSDLKRKRFHRLWSCLLIGYKESEQIPSAEQPLLPAERTQSQQFNQDVRQLGRIPFLSLSFFYAIYYVNLLLFVKQGNKLSGSVGDALYLSPQTMANSRMVFNVILSVLFCFLLFPALQKKIKCCPLRRIVLGCFCVVLSLTAGGIVESQTTPTEEGAVSITTFADESVGLCQPILRAPHQYLVLGNSTSIRADRGTKWTLLLRLACGHRSDIVEIKKELSMLFLFHRLNETLVDYRTMDYTTKPTTLTVFYVAPFGNNHTGERIYAFDADSMSLLGHVDHEIGEVMTLESPMFGRRTLNFYSGANCETDLSQCKNILNKTISQQTGAVFVIQTDLQKEAILIE